MTTKKILFAGMFLQAGMALARAVDCAQGYLGWQTFWLTLVGLGIAVAVYCCCSFLVEKE
jgi:hypothetical protein